eukprot:3369014-Pleurochrysis_carterae.AAC.1
MLLRYSSIFDRVFAAGTAQTCMSSWQTWQHKRQATVDCKVSSVAHLVVCSSAPTSRQACLHSNRCAVSPPPSDPAQPM